MNKIAIISEIGINHNGDVSIAKDMIKESKLCGADLVKFQKRDINLVYSKEMLESKRESPWGTTFKQQKEAYMKYECQEAGRMMMIAICEKSSY